MQEPSPKALDHLLNLAKDYDRKLRELHHLHSEIPLPQLFQRIRYQGESATDRFRSLQRILMTRLYDSDQEPDAEMVETALSLCRCFDEILILYHLLLDHVGSSLYEEKTP